VHRREFFQKSLIATLATRVLSDVTLAKASQAAPAPAQTPAAAAAARRLVLDIDTKNLQWIRNTDELAAAAIELTCGGVCPGIQGPPGYINPANVKTELPAFVNTMKKHGLRVKQVRLNGAVQPDAAIEALLGTMQQAGVTHYSIDSPAYDFSKPIMAQLDALKARVDQFVKLNQKYGTTLTYVTPAAGNVVGAAMWDLLSVLKDFDSKYVGFHWDTGNMARHGSDTAELLVRAAGPYIAAVSFKDRNWVQELGVAGETGPYPGPAGAAAAGGGRGGGRGAGAGAAPGGARGGGAGAGAAAAGGPPGAPGGQPPAGAPGGRGGGRGRGGGGAGDLNGVPRPLTGTTFARGGGWSAQPVPIGTGMVDLFTYGKILGEVGFAGPTDFSADYPNGGSEKGEDKITLPRIMVLGALKRDVLTIRAAITQANGGLTL